MGSLRSCTTLLRQASSSSAAAAAVSSSNGAAATALRALRSAGFDTPLPPSVAVAVAATTTATATATVAATVHKEASSVSLGVTSPSPCPLNALTGASVGSALPSLFASASRCPCGLYAASATPASCAWGAKKAKAPSLPHQQQLQVQMQYAAAKTTRMGASASRMGSGSSAMQVRAFSTAAAAAGASATPGAGETGGSSASTGTATATGPAPASPSDPPGVTLSPSFSAAHSGLWAIDEYRTAVQQLNRSSTSAPQPAQARASLRRTLDIVAYIPNQPFFGLHVKNLLAHAAMKLGAHAEERALRAEVLREVERMWLAATSPRDAAAHKPPLKDADALVLHQALNAHVLASLRLHAYDDVRALCDTWLPRAETLLFGGAPPPHAGGAAPGAPAAGRHAHAHGHAFSPPSSSFATGAIHSKLLAEYLTLTQALLVSQLCASLSAQGGDATVQAQRREAVQRRVGQLARHMASKPHLQASPEWRLFQGELLLLPQQVHQFVDLSALLPPPPPPAAAVAASTTAKPASDAPAQPLSMLERAVYYFQTQHPELARLPLGETNLRRQWYSPLVHALLLASEAMADPAASATAANAAAAGSSGPSGVSSERSLSLLSQCLSYVETHISSDGGHTYLLRTLLALGVVSYVRLADAIQSEGLFRAVTARLEGLLAGAATSSSSGSGSAALQGGTADAQRLSLYVDALAEYVFLLSKLEWNKSSRAPEARALLHARLIVPAQRDPALRALLAQLLPDARRCIDIPLGDAVALAALRSPADVGDAMLALPLRPAVPAPDTDSASAGGCGACPRRVLPLPEWLVDKLQVGSGVNNDNGAR